MAVHVNKDVLRLDVPEDDVALMQMLEAQKHLAHIELGLTLRKLALVHQVIE